MAEPTSALTFSDLILEVAIKLGLAYHGADGTETDQIPTDTRDLDLCKRIVNNGIRMFIHDAPQPNGWRWLRPVASVTLWSDIAADTGNPILTAVHSGGITTLTVGEDSFFESMELKDITITTVGTFTITEFVSATSIKVSGDASAAHGTSKTWTMTDDGNYTLPLTFSGHFVGHIAYASGTNRGIGIEWCDESVIRMWRADVTDENGDPWLAAVRVMDTGSPRRRWELIVYPMLDEDMVVEFPFMLHFNELTSLTEVHPAPFSHDETVKAACLAVAEKEVEDAYGPDWTYYRESALPQSHRIDAMNAPRKLVTDGRLGSIQHFRTSVYQRPVVNFNG